MDIQASNIPPHHTIKTHAEMLQITQQLIILTRTFVMVTDSIVQRFYYKPYLNKNTSITCYKVNI